MKIVCIIDNFLRAGTQLHLQRLVVELSKRGHVIHLVSLEGGGDLAPEFERTGVAITLLKTGAYYRRNTLPVIFQLAERLRQIKPDIVHTFLLKANLVGPAAAGMAGVPVVLTSRRSLGYNLKPNHLQMLGFIEQNWTDGIVANAKAIADITVDREGVLREQIHVIPNGIDPNQFQKPPDQTFCTNLGIPPSVQVIGCVANIRPVKGYEYLLTAFAKVVWQYSKMHLLIVGNAAGNADYLKILEAQAAELGISQKMTIWQDCTDIPSALALIDIAVLSSTSEGMSNALLEYMAAEKPIIATSVGGNPEVIENGVSGLLVPPKDSIALAASISCLLSDDALAQNLGVSAQNRAQKYFALSIMLDRHEQLYQKLLTQKGDEKNGD